MTIGVRRLPVQIKQQPQVRSDKSDHNGVSPTQNDSSRLKRSGATITVNLEMSLAKQIQDKGLESVTVFEQESSFIKRAITLQL